MTKVGDKFMLSNNDYFKYETPQCCINVAVALHCGKINIGDDIRCNKTYTYDTNVEYIIAEMIFEYSII